MAISSLYQIYINASISEANSKPLQEIFCESVPKTAENFLALCAAGAYDRTPFHRLIPGFMIQGGDTSMSPQNNPVHPIPKGGQSIYSPAFEDEIRIPVLRHNTRGIVSMANKGPNTNGSQFFITFKEAGHLDGKNTVFGRYVFIPEHTLIILV